MHDGMACMDSMPQRAAEWQQQQAYTFELGPALETIIDRIAWRHVGLVLETDVCRLFDQAAFQGPASHDEALHTRGSAICSR